MTSYGKFSRFGLRPSAKKAYLDWIREYSDLLGTFATLTFPRLVSRETARGKGEEFGLLLNKRIFGNHFERRHEGLVSIFTVEGGLKIRDTITNPHVHLHYLIEKHSLVTSEFIKDVWAEIVGQRAARIGVKAERIPEEIPADNAIDYILKYVTWEYGPEVYIPKSLLRVVRNQ